MWNDQAACRDESLAVFFPEPERAGPGGVSYTEARAVCAACLVRAECLEDALAEEGTASSTGRHGMRGAMTPAQRATEDRQRRRETIGLHTVPAVGSLHA